MSSFLVNLFDSSSILFLIIKMGALATALGAIWNYAIKPLWTFLKKLNEHIQGLEISLPILEAIAKDFKPNGGNSLRDVINRIELRMDIIDERYKLLVELEDLGVFEADENGKYTWVSEGWMNVTNQSALEARGYGWQAGVHPEDRGKVSMEWEKAISQTRQFSMKYRIGENGHAKEIYCTAFPLKTDDGKILGYVGRVSNTNKL
jgi:PAS domain S-box-containing protein